MLQRNVTGFRGIIEPPIGVFLDDNHVIVIMRRFFSHADLRASLAETGQDNLAYARCSATKFLHTRNQHREQEVNVTQKEPQSKEKSPAAAEQLLLLWEQNINDLARGEPPKSAPRHDD